MLTQKTAQANPAEVYDSQFVPALFAHWGPVVVEAAAIKAGDRVLDVACGTGAATLAAAAVVGPSGYVTGLDANPQMLAVARRKAAPVQWVEGTAESLPMPDARFDAVISQFGMMFFEDKAQALREMWRVLRPGGGMAVAVCDAVENSPGYAAFVSLLDRLFGKQIGDAFRAPFALGDVSRLREIADDAGIADAKITRHDRPVTFSSIEALVSTERACAWTLGGLLDEHQFSRLLAESRSALSPFVTDRGVRFSMPSLILTARKT